MFIIFKFNVIRRNFFLCMWRWEFGRGSLSLCYFWNETKLHSPILFIFIYYIYTTFKKSFISKNKENSRNISINVSILYYHFCEFMTISKGRNEKQIVWKVKTSHYIRRENIFKWNDVTGTKNYFHDIIMYLRAQRLIVSSKVHSFCQQAKYRVSLDYFWMH